MSLLNPTDVLEESWLLFFLTGLLGLRVIRQRFKRWISYFYACFLIVLYYTSFFMIREAIWNHYESQREAIYYFEEQKLEAYFNLIVVLAVIISSIGKSSEDLFAYKKLDEIDRVLFYLNAPIDHEIQMRENVVLVCTYVSITILVNLFTYFALITADAGPVFNISWILNQTPVFLEIVTLCAFDTFVRKVRVRFGHINRVIGDLLGPRKVSLILMQATEINNASKLRLARRIHLQLHDAACAINNAYGLRLFLIFLVTLISVLNHFRKALNLLENSNAVLDLGLHLIWISFHLGKYYFLVNSCRAAVAEAKLPGRLFLDVSSAQGSRGLSEETNALSRQLVNNQLQFTACNVFSINFSKGLMILIAILAYFLLLA